MSEITASWIRPQAAARCIFAGAPLFDEAGNDRTTRARPRSVISAPGSVDGAGQSCHTVPANKAANRGVDNPKLVVRTVGRQAEAMPTAPYHANIYWPGVPDSNVASAAALRHIAAHMVVH